MGARRKSLYCESCGCYVPIGEDCCPACGLSIHPAPKATDFYYDTSTVCQYQSYVVGGRGNQILANYNSQLNNVVRDWDNGIYCDEFWASKMRQVSEEEKRTIQNKISVESVQSPFAILHQAKIPTTIRR